MNFKQKQWEAVREADRRSIADRLEGGTRARDVRLHRLLRRVAGSPVADEVNEGLRTLAEQRMDLRQTIHNDWSTAVHAPIKDQLHGYFNAPSRAEEQRLSGSRRVAFTEPHQEHFALRATLVDPVKRVLQDRDREEHFDREARRVIEGRCASAPELLGTTWGPGGSLKARSKDMLDPTLWRTEPLIAQVCMNSAPGNYLGRRAARAPREDDGVPTAGKKTVRIGEGFRHNDTGVLGDSGGAAGRGEAARSKTWCGSSCGAPAQDHYTYAAGRGITDAEFPLGKRMDPRWH